MVEVQLTQMDSDEYGDEDDDGVVQQETGYPPIESKKHPGFQYQTIDRVGKGSTAIVYQVYLCKIRVNGDTLPEYDAIEGYKEANEVIGMFGMKVIFDVNREQDKFGNAKVLSSSQDFDKNLSANNEALILGMVDKQFCISLYEDLSNKSDRVLITDFIIGKDLLKFRREIKGNKENLMTEEEARLIMR